MLLLHQIGSVYVGEVVRYTVTYTPSLDRILPPPSQLHVKIKNTSAIPLRAAYLHGPYTLYVSCYPSTFDPNKKQTNTEDEGEPHYEPQLKAGGQWTAKLTVPESVRQDAGLSDRKDSELRKSFTWIIEVSSQVLFSSTAAVHYELLVGRDEKSVSLGFTGVISNAGAPGRLEDHRLSTKKGIQQPRGVFTKAVKLKVDDTDSLWDNPAFPSPDETSKNPNDTPRLDTPKAAAGDERPRKRRKKIHLVILTHGLHSNLGADMLYLKESIEATAKQARVDAKNAKRDERDRRAEIENDFGRRAIDQRAKSAPDLAIAPTPSFEDDKTAESSETEGDEEEEVVVKGFRGNVVKTERGIQYLGKRLAKYVLSITYPDQPYLPVKSTITQSISRTFTGAPKPTQTDGKHPTHKGSSIAKDDNSSKHNLPYQITRLSFVGHSLGGLVQTYAIAYIQKHSPEFFDKIEPVNFVALATPFLGLSNENPMYVKFALDFGLVGRTGRDLGLMWRTPTMSRNGWGAVVGGFGGDNAKEKEQDPGTKPLLRILPTGPAHIALKRFRNRSVYSNVVNDGIVPLRTSCLLFLDWRGLGRVEKARRENGLVGTVVNWGLNELTGQNASTPRRGLFEDLFADSGDEANKPINKSSPDPGSAVPQAEASSGLDNFSLTAANEGDPQQTQMPAKSKPQEQNASSNLWSAFTSFFRPQAGTQKSASPKQQRIYQRGQTMNQDHTEEELGTYDQESESQSLESSPSNHRKLLVRGSSLYTNNSDNDNLDAPPRTTVFESAGDLLNPPLPPKEFLLDPATRPRTIFHDRVYHPEDIPPPPTKRQRTFMRSRPNTGDKTAVPNQDPEDLNKISSSKTPDQGGMRIEEKIARAYHKDMAWRKVLVRLEPDAHNNLIVRRMFANAYGWPVVKHMCDTHFGYTAAALTRDQDESPVERAKPEGALVGKEGEQVQDQTQKPEETQRQDGSDPQRAATTESMPEREDHEIDTLHIRQKNIRASQQPEKPTLNDTRTTSEIRESRDQISDLISMVSVQGEPNQSYSSMHSGTAALHRLARQDSGRWSDRFFDSSDDEDPEDETDLDLELQRAYDRGIGFNPDKSAASSMRSRKSARGRGSKRGSLGRSLLPETDGPSRLVAEPEPYSRTSSLRSSISEQPIDAQTLSLTGVGLGRNQQDIADEINDDGPTSPSGTSISEQVARVRSLSGGADQERQKRPSLGTPKPSVD